MMLAARMNAPTYPEADHSAVARPTTSRMPAALLCEVIDWIGPAKVLAALLGPSWDTTCVIVLLVDCGSATSPMIETSAISAGNSDSRP
jgi:hypothetical protein